MKYRSSIFFIITGAHYLIIIISCGQKILVENYFQSKYAECFDSVVSDANKKRSADHVQCCYIFDTRVIHADARVTRYPSSSERMFEGTFTRMSRIFL